MRPSTSLFPLILLVSHPSVPCAQTLRSPELQGVSWLVGLLVLHKSGSVKVDFCLTVLYNPEDESEHTFIPHVQDIVKSLYEISQEIPSDSVTDVYNLGRDQSLRTTASLHLMLFQVRRDAEFIGMDHTNICIGNYSYNQTDHASCCKANPQWPWSHWRAAASFTTR